MDLKLSHGPSTTQHPELFYIPSFILNRELYHAIVLVIFLITSIIFYGIIKPFQPQSLFEIGFLSQILPNARYISPKVCDYSYGEWVWDESHPLHKYTESCPFLDPGFRCQQNARRDTNYQKWRWKPRGCHLPRFDAIYFLNRFQNGRVVFVGDSIGRNQWESLLCMLAQGVSNQSTIYEEYGSSITKHKGFLSMRFAEYNLTVQYYRVPFLVVVDRPPKNASKEVRGAIRVDKLHWFSTKWVGANVLVFSAGHWWNEDKTVKSGHYFQEGGTVNMTMDFRGGFQEILKHVDAVGSAQFEARTKSNHLPQLFTSALQCRDGSWNEGGHCHTFKAPETGRTKLEPEPLNNLFISEAIKQMKSAQMKAQFLNITYLTELRKDGHPSRYRESGTPVSAPQDCSHWCLPGVPDTWNEILYAHLLSK